jgi:hypothetical protein
MRLQQLLRLLNSLRSFRNLAVESRAVRLAPADFRKLAICEFLVAVQGIIQRRFEAFSLGTRHVPLNSISS